MTKQIMKIDRIGVLTLPRQFCLINLKNDQILQNDNDTINGSLSEANRLEKLIS